MGNADASGFSLELHRSSSTFSDTNLRFGVRINGSYRYVEVDADNFNGTDSYQITGAYDGDGYLRLMVNNEEWARSGPWTGDVTVSDSPIVVGADPQGSSSTRFHFDGKIQQVNVQAWANHR